MSYCRPCSDVCVCRPTWVALGHSVNVGGVEHADSCASPVLHTHAHAQEQSCHRPHQKHHAKDDTGDGSATGKKEKTHTHLLLTSQLLPWRSTAASDVTQLRDVCVRA